MSDQDEISKLLAEANAEATPLPETTEQAAAPAPVRPHPHRLVGRNSDILGVAWLNGSLHAATFRRQKMTHSWSCETAVLTMAEFEAVLDEALSKLEFGGTEMFLVLEHEQFSHQTESLPAFSEAAGRTYLKGRLQRHEQEFGPVLWVGQPTIEARREQSIILHLLPRSFYDQLNRTLLTRHLDLTRILPLIVPLQYELNKIPAGKNTPVLVVAEMGTCTGVAVGRIGGSLLFSRTILADLNREPSRVGVEVNRSLLYAKQQFECAVDRIWLLAANGQSSAELNAKCSSAKKIIVLPTTPIDWLQTTIKISPQHPVNLLSGYLKTKSRRRLVRSAALAAAWLGLVLMCLSSLNEARELKEEKNSTTLLQGQESRLLAERERLASRNAMLQQEQSLIRQIESGRLPPVPGRFLGLLAGALPASARLNECNVKWDPETDRWSFQFQGTIETDEDTARDLIVGLQTELLKSPLRARFNEGTRLLMAVQPNPANPREIQRFNLEGSLLEK